MLKKINELTTSIQRKPMFVSHLYFISCVRFFLLINFTFILIKFLNKSGSVTIKLILRRFRITAVGRQKQ